VRVLRQVHVQKAAMLVISGWVRWQGRQVAWFVAVLACQLLPGSPACDSVVCDTRALIRQR
jgi:hypothetical protein